MTLDKVNSRYPGALSQSEIINQYGIAYVHLIEWIASYLRDLQSGFRRFNLDACWTHGTYSTYFFRYLGIGSKSKNLIQISTGQQNFLETPANHALRELRDLLALPALHMLRRLRSKNNVPNWLHE